MATLDDRYLTWLYKQVADVRLTEPSMTCWGLLKQLYTKEFVWFVPNDDNRVEDGKNLRAEFVEQLRIRRVDPTWMGLGCSMLEMLIALSRRLAFEGGSKPANWFWHLMRNLDIKFTDVESFPREDVEEALERVIWRTYAPDGGQGLFPLREASQDQRKVEIWYQLCAYLLEREYTEGG